MQISWELWPTIWNFASFPQVVKLLRICKTMQIMLQQMYQPSMISFFDAREKLICKKAMQKMVLQLPSIFAKTIMLNLCGLNNRARMVVDALSSVLKFSQIQVLLQDRVVVDGSIRKFLKNVPTRYLAGCASVYNISCANLLTNDTTPVRQLIQTYGMHRQHLVRQVREYRSPGLFHKQASVQQLQAAIDFKIHHYFYSRYDFANIFSIVKHLNTEYVIKFLERMQDVNDFAEIICEAIVAHQDMTNELLQVIIQVAKQRIPEWERAKLLTYREYNYERVLFVMDQGFEFDDAHHFLSLFYAGSFKGKELEMFALFEDYRMKRGKSSITTLKLADMDLLHIAVAKGVNDEFISMILKKNPKLKDWNQTSWNTMHAIAKLLAYKEPNDQLSAFEKYSPLCGSDMVAMANVIVPNYGNFFNVLCGSSQHSDFAHTIFERYPALNVHNQTSSMHSFASPLLKAIARRDKHFFKAILQSNTTMYQCNLFAMQEKSIVELLHNDSLIECYCEVYQITPQNLLIQQHPVVPQTTIGVHFLHGIAKGQVPIPHVKNTVLTAMDQNPDFSILLEAAAHKQAHVIHFVLPLRPVKEKERLFVQHFSKNCSTDRNVLGHAFRYGIYPHSPLPLAEARFENRSKCLKCHAIFHSSNQLKKHVCVQ